jgi:hypothetical protein
MTPFKKQLPLNQTDVLSALHVNTGYTTNCPRDGEIVVYRKEEWFKVFLHETIHHFSVDFSHMDQTAVKQRMLSIFDVDSEVNLFESYTEWWAEIFNLIFCTCIKDNKVDKVNRVNMFNALMKKEVQHGFTQMCKVLNHMGLTYEDLFYKNHASKHLRRKNYREKSNILAYYVIHQILLYYWQDFLVWCDEHNRKGGQSVFEIDHSNSTLMSFVDFIEAHYDADDFMRCVKHEVVKHEVVKHEVVKHERAKGSKIPTTSSNRSFSSSLTQTKSLRMTLHDVFH